MPAHVYIQAPDVPRPLVDAALMREVGDLATRLIRTRTMAGRDVRNQSFAPYTPGYAKTRDKAGLGSSPVTLTVSGRMLNDMGVVDAMAGRVSLGFRSSGGRTSGPGLTLIQRSRAVGAQDKATWHNETGAGASRTVREFFGLTPEEEATVRSRVARALSDIIRRANR